MPHLSALPFVLRRSDDVIRNDAIISTTERIHGLLRIDGERLVVQWRVARETERVGSEIRTDQEFEPVREVVLPLSSLAGVAVRWRGWGKVWWGPQVVLTGTDLRAFEEIAGATGLKQDHPATLVLPIRRGDRLSAQEFAADLNLMLADRALPGASAPVRLPPGRT